MKIVIAILEDKRRFLLRTHGAVKTFNVLDRLDKIFHAIEHQQRILEFVCILNSLLAEVVMSSRH